MLPAVPGAAQADKIMAQNKVTGIFKLQKEEPCRPNLTNLTSAGTPIDKCICLYNTEHSEEWRAQTRQLPYSVKEQEIIAQRLNMNS